MLRLIVIISCLFINCSILTPNNVILEVSINHKSNLYLRAKIENLVPTPVKKKVKKTVITNSIFHNFSSCILVK